MRVINVVTVRNGAVYDLESFGVYEEQLSQDVVDKAEKVFREKVVEMMKMDNNFKGEFSDINEDNFDVCIEEGLFQNAKKNSVSITWSDI